MTRLITIALALAILSGCAARTYDVFDDDAWDLRARTAPKGD